MARVKRRTLKKRGNMRKTRRQRKLSRKTMLRKRVRGGVNIRIISQIINIKDLNRELDIFADKVNIDGSNYTIYDNKDRVDNSYKIYFISSKASSKEAESLLDGFNQNFCYIKGKVIHVAHFRTEGPSADPVWKYYEDIATYTFNDDRTIIQQVGNSTIEILGELFVGEDLNPFLRR